jgi:hypothetical protein
MLVTVGLALLVIWAIGVVGPLEVGQLVHVLLLAGLMLLLIAFVKARDVALSRTRITATSEDTNSREPKR